MQQTQRFNSSRCFSQHSAHGLRRGLGRIEVALALGTLACGLMLLFPLAVWSREQSRFAQCQGNLKTIGISMHTFATTDPEERFLTGAPSFELDGCPDTYGWPADMVAMGTGRADELRCPTNRIQGTEWVTQALTGDESNVPEERRAKGFCAKLPPVSSRPTSQQIESRLGYVQDALSRQGANTNYACSWFAARGTPKTFVKYPKRGCWGAWVEAGPYRQIGSNVEGPLRRRTVDQSDVLSHTIPILGDGAPAFGAPRTLPILVRWARGRLAKDDPLAAAFGAGPAFVPSSGEAMSPAIAEADVASLLGTRPPRKLAKATFSGPDPWLPSTSYGTLGPQFVAQDTRHWRATHGSKANLLMADASIRVLEDVNGDGFFNPGFPRPPDLDDATVDREHGYRDGLVEINWQEVYSGVSLSSHIVTTSSGCWD